MTNTQLYLAMLGPVVGNVLAITLAFTLLSSRFSDLRGGMADLRADLNTRMAELRADLTGRLSDLRTELDRRLTDQDKALRRVEEILDARVKTLEEGGKRP